MNKTIVIGRLVREPETKATNSGVKYTRFTVAADRGFGDKQSDFIPVIAWNHQAHFVEQFLGKGSLVAIEGRFTSSSFKNKEGQTVTRYEVTAESVQGLESKVQVEARRNQVQDDIVVDKPQTVVIDKSKTVDKSEQDGMKIDNTPWDLDL